MIEKKRIRSLNYFSAVNEGEDIYLGAQLTEGQYENALKCGFTDDFNIGESVLPACIGTVTRRNANGDTILLRDLPMEDYCYTIEWTRQQWIGGGDTEEVTGYVDVTRKRYQREQTVPYNKYLTILEINGIKCVISDKITYNESNADEIIHTTNLILEHFHKCEIYNSKLERLIQPEVKRLDWTILPEGEKIWAKAHEYVDSVVKPFKNRKSITHERIDILKKLNLKLIAIGNAGFNGYMVFRHNETHLFFLENPRINNATYIFDGNWEEFSKLTKAEIISNKYFLDRIIHSLKWEENVNCLLSEK
jgi:hypothetical protein